MDAESEMGGITIEWNGDAKFKISQGVILGEVSSLSLP